MNLLQHCLLKLGEESGEIATSLLLDDCVADKANSFSNGQEIRNEINDLEAVIRILNQEFNFNFGGLSRYQNIYHSRFALENSEKDLSFWALYTINICLSLSKLTSKCIQFGLREKEQEFGEDNYSRVCSSLRDLFFGIDQLNKFGLDFTLDEERVSRKIAKVNQFRRYSIELDCVSDEPVSNKFLPVKKIPNDFRIFPDEYSYIRCPNDFDSNKFDIHKSTERDS
ncbi:hypothetical protein ACQWTT_001337 [Acinetobacter baumannii]